VCERERHQPDWATTNPVARTVKRVTRKRRDRFMDWLLVRNLAAASCGDAPVGRGPSRATGDCSTSPRSVRPDECNSDAENGSLTAWSGATIPRSRGLDV
jgi:hypothetical protein